VPGLLNATLAPSTLAALNAALPPAVLAHIKWVPAGALATVRAIFSPTAALVVEAEMEGVGLVALNCFWQAYNKTTLASIRPIPVIRLLLFINKVYHFLPYTPTQSKGLGKKYFKFSSCIFPPGLSSDNFFSFLPSVNCHLSTVNSFFNLSPTFRCTFIQTFNMWWIYALLSALFAALTAIFAKVGVKNVDSNLATAIRTTVIFILVWGIALFKGVTPSIQNLQKQTWLFLILSGCATGLSWLFYFKALQIGKVSQVAPVDKLSVALAIILSVVFFGEVITWKIAAGALLIIAGTIVLIL
jgi:transporter family protein